MQECLFSTHIVPLKELCFQPQWKGYLALGLIVFKIFICEVYRWIFSPKFVLQHRMNVIPDCLSDELPPQMNSILYDLRVIHCTFLTNYAA